MRRVLPLLALIVLSAPASQASSHTHTAIATHAHAFHSAASTHPHAPSIFPGANPANPGEPEAVNTQTRHESSLAAFVVRTMLAFSAHFSH